MPIVKWLAGLARNSGKPVLLLHHLRKRGLFDSGEGVSLDRVRGSTVIVQPARVIWALDVPGAKKTNLKRLSVIKSNLARFPDPVSLIIDHGDIIFRDAPAAPQLESQGDRATELLLALLKAGPVISTEIQDEARRAHISWDTMRRAKEKLGIAARRDGTARKWLWTLPNQGDD